MIAEVKDFLIPLGGTLGDLINATPRDIISRVYLEDKMFETWNHGRVALIGDGRQTGDIMMGLLYSFILLSLDHLD